MGITKNESAIDWANYHLNILAKKAFEENSDKSIVEEIAPGEAVLSKVMSKDVL